MSSATRALAARVLLGGLCILGPNSIAAASLATASFASQVSRGISADFEDDKTTVGADQETLGPSAPSPESPDAPTEYQRRIWEPADCVLLAGADPILDTWCAGPQDIDLYEIACPDGTTFAWPMKIRSKPTTATEWGPWRLVNSTCMPVTEDGEAGSIDGIADDLARQIATLKIPPRHARLDPVTDWFVVQLPMTFFTDAGTETLTTTVLGTDVELELTPTEFSWDPGDGSTPIRTTQPGKAYPDQTTTHVYARKGTYQVTLTTTWAGRFRIAGTTTWYPITGTGTTTHTSAPFETREVRSVLS